MEKYKLPIPTINQYFHQITECKWSVIIIKFKYFNMCLLDIFMCNIKINIIVRYYYYISTYYMNSKLSRFDIISALYILFLIFSVFFSN